MDVIKDMGYPVCNVHAAQLPPKLESRLRVFQIVIHPLKCVLELQGGVRLETLTKLQETKLTNY